MTNPNDPATPSEPYRDGYGHYHEASPGLTKREAFAMHAPITPLPEYPSSAEVEDAAASAAQYADALIAALNATAEDPK